jgi:hypothetical protein
MRRPKTLSINKYMKLSPSIDAHRGASKENEVKSKYTVPENNKQLSLPL